MQRFELGKPYLVTSPEGVTKRVVIWGIVGGKCEAEVDGVRAVYEKGLPDVIGDYESITPLRE